MFSEMYMYTEEIYEDEISILCSLLFCNFGIDL